MWYQGKRHTFHRPAAWSAIVVLIATCAARSEEPGPASQPEELSRYMNSVPPSKDYFCVGNGPNNTALHPDRAPYTGLAEQGGVILFSGAAPQQGLNFVLRAGDLVYRNQMSTLGSAEPPPQVGTAGMLLQRPWERLLPWSEARWHPGEDISWHGYRAERKMIAGLPYWAYDNGQSYPEYCGGDGVDPAPYKPLLSSIYTTSGPEFNIRSSFNLQLARGIYQASKVRATFYGTIEGECPSAFREPWFQGRGLNPAYNVTLNRPDNGSPLRLGGSFFPNYLSIYNYRTLELDGGRLYVDFERSATWPRQPLSDGGATSGAMMASEVRDEYGNRVVFDRVPKYGWETDYKPPADPDGWMAEDPVFGALPAHYAPTPNAWRLPHKRVRTVQLFAADSDQTPEWTIAFVFEDPESDRIGPLDTPDTNSAGQPWDDWKEWKSLYSDIQQANWSFGRLPELNDETTLLTVQAYSKEHLAEATFKSATDNGDKINGNAFHDDGSVWRDTLSTGATDRKLAKKRVCDTGTLHTFGRCADDPGWPVRTFDPPGADGPDPCPGQCGIDDDGDGLKDEDTNGYQACLNTTNDRTCSDWREYLIYNTGSSNGLYLNGKLNQKPQTCTEDSGGAWTCTECDCKNPLYWHGWDGNDRTDPFAHWDDDEDGLIDEDGDDNPLLVDLRADDMSGFCSTGKHPFVPQYAYMPSLSNRFLFDCRPVTDADRDPWTHQVQYVYARSNPFWLLSKRNDDGTRTAREAPVYYYYPPFTEPYDDTNKNGIHDPGEPYVELTGNTSFDEFPGDGVPPNVHPDCVPSPKFRGPQGRLAGGTNNLEPLKPSDIHLIKRIVRTRPDPIAEAQNYIESVWLYRYNDYGFLKAVFDPTSVQQIIDADDAINEPDDILKLADTAPVGPAGTEKPLIMYASKWYDYYNPYLIDPENIPPCYDDPPVVASCTSNGDTINPDDVNNHLPLNACDGEALWRDEPSDEMHIDPDCSAFVRQDCGWCYARDCGAYDCPSPVCGCYSGSLSTHEDLLTQMGIPDAQPRFRKYLVKTARVRGDDGEMHLYRYDYLGAASSVYTDEGRITSYADPHNITIVDELVEQTDAEFAVGSGDRSDFYVYEDRFRLVLDGTPDRAESYNNGQYFADSHYLHFPVKVKTRRVVVMNYYGIAISDRLILTPGYKGDQASLVDNQQYELLNRRGQAKHIYDQSWVAGLREMGKNFVKTSGRVLTQLFGGNGGRYSVLQGIAKGSNGGNLYNQQCKTPEVTDEVPVQRVAPDQLNVVHVAQHNAGDSTADLVSAEAVYYRPMNASALYEGTSPAINDPAGTIGSASCMATPAVTSCTCGDDGCTDDGTGNCSHEDFLPGIDLRNQDPVQVTKICAVDGTGCSTDPPTVEGDGVSVVRYFYDFHEPPNSSAVKWKWRWQEAVSPAHGGTGNVALDVWFYDQRGLLLFEGHGSGEFATEEAVHPSPVEPFYVTYHGYDELGRPFLTIEDVNVSDVLDSEASYCLGASELSDEDDFTEIQVDPVTDPHTPINRVTRNEYNGFGALTSTTSGTTSNVTSWCNNEAKASALDDTSITEIKLLANRSIRHQEAFGDPVVWQDPYSYQIVYQGADGTGNVYGTTSITVFDKGGRFLENRVVAWNPARDDADSADKIPDPGWGISLADYSYDGAIAGWGSPTSGYSIPGDRWSDCGSAGQDDCYTYVSENKDKFLPRPPMDADDTLLWPPTDTDQIVTLARSFKRYEQSSTLKPTHDIVYNDFTTNPSDPSVGERRQVVRQYMYDLEDRIARQEEPDGTVSRFLFDPKRRPTKVFRGSTDDCSDWFPRNTGATGDDMLLTEHMLYNDGDSEYESNEQWVAVNEDFPNDAGKLVRTRRYADDAEPCGAAYNESARSRDTQYVYDWRGRPVITKEVAVGYAGATVAEPYLLSATVTVYDNLDRPIVVATFGRDENAEEPTLPAVSDIEGWQDLGTELAPEPWALAVVGGIFGMAQDLQTISGTLYDERGRVYEQRSYDPGAPTQFTSTRTYYDDLDRVTKRVTASGVTTNKYDALGRVIETSRWTLNDPDTHDQGAGTELTRTVRTYDAHGNVLTEVHYDRKPGTDGTAALDAGENAIITYTYNWYHEHNKRLIATAYFGTGAADGYTTNTTPPLGSTGNPPWDPNLPPQWVDYGATHGYFIGGDLNNGMPDAQVTLYDYDAAGRRDFVRDPKGVITKTWFDLLGRQLLVAENWKIPGTAGTPLPFRYTAYHYTRGGLLDMMVAIVKDSGVGSFTPDDLGWTEDPDADYAATAITVETARVQATRFVYGAHVVNETKNLSAAQRDVVSKSPTLVQAIHYPDPVSGQPSLTDKVTYTFTIDGKVASRTDQRGVTLDYFYGDCPDCAETTLIPHDALTEVDVNYPAPMPADEALADTVDYLAFDRDARGQLTAATTYAHNETDPASRVAFTYDALGNLTSETLDPTPGTSSLAKTTVYEWGWDNVDNGMKTNRLTGITYPSGPRKINFGYDDPFDKTRMTLLGPADGAGGVASPLLAYSYTAGGRNIVQTWGNPAAPAIKLDYSTAGHLDRFGRILTMDFKKGQNTIHKYSYGYDANGNRTFAKIEQKLDGGGFTTDRSYLYGYDRLNRLIYAERGTLNETNDAIIDGGKGRAWNLDVLGNWSGNSNPFDPGPGDDKSVIDYTIATDTAISDPNDPGYTSAHDDIETVTHHEPDATNKITQLSVDDDGDDATPPIDTNFYHDAAGNLVFDGDKFYQYDAWNHIAAVHDNNSSTPLSVDPTSGNLTGTPGDLIATYGYDALGRRIAKHVLIEEDPPPSTPNYAQHYFYYDGHRLLEHYKDDGAGTMALLRQYVYGMEYIDEVVAYYDSAASGAPPHFVLQDASYNVVGVTESTGALEEQYTYTPYGQRLTAEGISGTTVSPIDITTSLDGLALTLGYKGLRQEPETGFWYSRNRDLDSILGRFRQKDPNETGLLVASALCQNAQTALAMASVSPSVQYDDGMNLYEYAHSNAVTGSDPSGLFSYLDISASTAVQGELLAQVGDMGVDAFSSALGVILLGNDRNAVIDRMLGMTVNDESAFAAGAFMAIEYYRIYQMGRMAMTGGLLGAKALKAGAKAFARFAKRAGGRFRLMQRIRGGMNSVRRFFGFGRRGSYAHLLDPPNVGAGKGFTKKQKDAIIADNRRRNGGVVRSDITGEELVKPKKSTKGVTPAPNEWQIDHIEPKSNGGTNSFSNAQVLSRAENRAKSRN